MAITVFGTPILALAQIDIYDCCFRSGAFQPLMLRPAPERRRRLACPAQSSFSTASAEETSKAPGFSTFSAVTTPSSATRAKRWQRRPRL